MSIENLSKGIPIPVSKNNSKSQLNGILLAGGLIIFSSIGAAIYYSPSSQSIENDIQTTTSSSQTLSEVIERTYLREENSQREMIRFTATCDSEFASLEEARTILSQIPTLEGRSTILDELQRANPNINLENILSCNNENTYISNITASINPNPQITQPVQRQETRNGNCHTQTSDTIRFVYGPSLSSLPLQNIQIIEVDYDREGDAFDEISRYVSDAIAHHNLPITQGTLTFFEKVGDLTYHIVPELNRVNFRREGIQDSHRREINSLLRDCRQNRYTIMFEANPQQEEIQRNYLDSFPHGYAEIIDNR